MIHAPNLDDRTYKDILDEAIRLIPHYCPEWTNHNPSDPGITLLELFAWMIEMCIYRLNQVPEKVYLTLLDLIGLSPSPLQSSKVLLTFSPVERFDETLSAGKILVKRGIQVSTVKSEDGNSIVFETEKDLEVTNIELKACISTENGLVTDNLETINVNDGEGFSLFSGSKEIKRYIYISDPCIGFLEENNTLNIFFNNANEIKSLSDEIVNFLEWEYWNGKRWTSVEFARSLPGIRKEDNEIYFSGPIDIVKTEIENIDGYFLRASLNNIPEREKCFEMIDIRSMLLFNGVGLNPDACVCNTENMVFIPIDLNKEFNPFVRIPKYNDAFYIASDEVFSKEDSVICINFQLSAAEVAGKPEIIEELNFKYEYWDGRNWLILGVAKEKGVEGPAGEYNFFDTTNALTKSGEVKFIRPNNIKKTEINGQKHYWIRVRITAGDFGEGGKHQINEEGKWEWIYDKPMNSSLISHIKLSYLAAKKPVQHMLSYSDFHYFDFSKAIAENYARSIEEDDAVVDFFKVFEINKEECAITYFGFNKMLYANDHGIYFKINDKKRVKPEQTNLYPSQLGINIKRTKRPLSLKWEYWSGLKWKNLSVNDYTDNFHESGFIEFRCPNDIKEKLEFGKELFWLRLVFESGSFETNPIITAINLNSVYAYNRQTYINELLGSSNGAPSLELSFLHDPVLPGMEIIVKENEVPPADERALIISEEGEDSINIVKDNIGKDEVWIRYHQVDNFYASTPKSRHYCIDFKKNIIIFGDGNKGIIPPRIKNNIVAAKYQVGGGQRGNVGSGTVKNIIEKIPFIEDVTNFYSAEGGADLESIESLKSRASNIFKNLNRAVTAEDYEWLAKEASSSVARAKCLSKCGKQGEVIVIILPKPDLEEFNIKEKIYPTSELLRRVKEFLNARKLVGSKLSVLPPVYINISLNLKIVFKKEISEIQILKNQVELSVRRYLHPITGGAGGKGWPFGAPLNKNDVFRVLEKIDGIYYIEDIEIINDDSEVSIEKLVLDEDNLIFVNKIDIIERKYQF